MNEHVNSEHRAVLNRMFRPIPDDEYDHRAREQAIRERDYERRRAAHPDPHDPDHPDELEPA